MKIGRLQIIVFKNIVLRTGMANNAFWVKLNKHGISIQILKWCVMTTLQRRKRWKSGKPITGKEFVTLMKSKGIDLSKMTSVEISINGVTPIKT